MQKSDKNTWLYLARPDWIAFFQAPAAIVESARNGTWLAPVSGMVITGLMWHPILWNHLGWFDLIVSLIWLSIGIFYALGLPQLRHRSDLVCAVRRYRQLV